MCKKMIAAFSLMALLSLTLIGCGGKDENTIVVAEGEFAEPTIIAHMTKELLENHTDLNVVINDPMSTVPLANAMKASEIDLTLSYDGTLLATILQGDPSEVPEGEDLYDYVLEKASAEAGLSLGAPFGFENTYALAVKEDFAEEHNLETISDLVALAPDLRFGAEHEFFAEEGTIRINPLNRHYNLNWGDSISLDIGLKYAAIDNDNIDVILVYTTDGLNRKSELKVLEDDLNFFPQYYGALLMRDSLYEEFAEQAPELEEVLLSLEGQISDEEMTDMNYQVDAEGRDAAEVAKEFLESKNLI